MAIRAQGHGHERRTRRAARFNAPTSVGFLIAKPHPTSHCALPAAAYTIERGRPAGRKSYRDV
jgi:hypothetical protein